MANTWPEEVQNNWDEKVEGIKEWAESQIVEIQQFGEAFDSE